MRPLRPVKIFGLATLFCGFCLSHSLPIGSCVLAQEKLASPTNADISDRAGQSGQPEMARGIVFVDVDGDGQFGEGDIPQPGVRVSNGIDFATTDRNGQYEISVDDDSIVFLVKPRGRRTPVNDQQLPQFYYIHKPAGSPKLRFEGVAPTGELPDSIDFPLYEQDEPKQFSALMFGDPQGRNIKEIDYIAKDVIAELVGDSSAFGVTLGDIVFDDLDLFAAQNQAVAMVGIPWYNVIGNHDINFDARNREHANETFERVYGPSYYSFEYGHVHFVVLDNINWIVPDDPVQGAPHYVGEFGERQLQWLKNDLELIDDQQMVVLLMHIPVMGCKDAQQLYRLIEDRPLCISLSGHTHFHAHRLIDEAQGWGGEKPHHHIINVTVSGSWWGGQKDERGIPHATMSDGAPNGYSILSFDGDNYSIDFKAANKPIAYQMSISMPDEIAADELTQTLVHANIFNARPDEKVELSIDNSPNWSAMVRRVKPDPAYVQLVERELKIQPIIEPGLPQPGACEHLWSTNLPEDLEPGHHILSVRWTNTAGEVRKSTRMFRVLKPTTESDSDQ